MNYANKAKTIIYLINRNINELKLKRQTISSRIFVTQASLNSLKKDEAKINDQIEELELIVSDMKDPEKRQGPIEPIVKDEIEPGQTICHISCPGCQKELEIVHGDEVGEFGCYYNS